MARTKQVIREATEEEQFYAKHNLTVHTHNCGNLCGYYGRFNVEGEKWLCPKCGMDNHFPHVDDTKSEDAYGSDEDEDLKFEAIPVVDLTDRDCPPAPKKQAKESDFTKKNCCRKIDFDAVTLEYHSDNGLDDIEFRGSMLLTPEDDDCKIIGENWGAAVKRKRDVTLCIESNATIKTLFDTLKHYVVETEESNEIVDRVYALVNKNA